MCVIAGVEPGHPAEAEDIDGAYGCRACPGCIKREAFLGVIRRQRKGAAPLLDMLLLIALEGVLKWVVVTDSYGSHD